MSFERLDAKFLDWKNDMEGYKHTGAINLYENGVDLLEIMKL